jgi:myxalamid-type polyketide synthase MxaB
LDVTSAAALQVFGQGVHQVEDLIIHQPFVIQKTEKRRVRTSVEKLSENEAQWTIQSQSLQSSDAQWVMHVSGRMSAFVQTTGSTPTLQEVLQDCRHDITAQEHYAVFARQGIPYGPEFKVVRRVKVGTAQVLGEVQLQEKLANNCSQYLMHPALLDGCLQVGNNIITEIIGSQDRNFKLYLPFSFETWQYYGYSGGPVWCLAIHRGARRLDQPIQMDLVL